MEQNKTRVDELRALLDARREATLKDIAKSNPALQMITGLAGEETVMKLISRRVKYGNKYTPHQGNREKFRRAMKISKSHPTDCHCETCEYVMSVSGTQD